MERTLAAHLVQCVGKKVWIRGWLHTVRALGKITFVIVRDRSGLAQVVLDDKEKAQQLCSLQPGSLLQVWGEVATCASDLGCEIVSASVEIEVPIREVPCVEYYKPQIPSDLEHILDHRPIALRNRQIQAVFTIQAELAHAYRLFMHDQIGAVEYFAPNILGASSEGGAEFFHVDYFGHTATLAQSSQLYKQIMVGVNERVFALMPFFRAESSHTTRHLTEGKQFEFEMGFFNHWHEILDVQEGCIKYMVAHLQIQCAKEIALLGGKMIRAPQDVPFPRLTFAQAQELYFTRTGIDERQEPDLSPAAERELCKYAGETYGTDLIFITDWLTTKRPFYAFPTEGNPSLTNTFDLLCGGTEITSGGQRAHTYEAMVAGIRSKGMDPENFSDYLSIFRYGMPPHGGFGMGLERLTMTFLGLKNIREASLFPSDPKRIASKRIKARVFCGAENIRNEIIRLLRHQDIVFTHITHAHTQSSEEAAQVRGTSIKQGVKALIVRGKNSKKNYQFAIPADRKLDMKAVAERVGEKCEFESPEKIEEQFGLQVGGVPPFGGLLHMETFFDEKIEENDTVAFNCGLPTESIMMCAVDLLACAQGERGSFSKE